jgi:hypothetical protein
MVALSVELDHLELDAVALATLVVALVTGFLAWATWRLGTRAAEEIRAQWRPVLLVRARQWPGDQKLVVDRERLTVDIENVGRGPALGVTAVGRSATELGPATPVSALAPQEVTEFDFPLPHPHPQHVSLRLNYSDLTQASYETSVVLNLAERRVIAQDFEMYRPFKLGWYRLVPRPLRRHLAPVAERRFRRRAGA